MRSTHDPFYFLLNEAYNMKLDSSSVVVGFVVATLFNIIVFMLGFYAK